MGGMDGDEKGPSNVFIIKCINKGVLIPNMVSKLSMGIRFKVMRTYVENFENSRSMVHKESREKE